MSDPRRLLDDAQTTDLQRSLLGSFADEAAPSHARQRTLAALGLPAAVGGATTLAAAMKASSTSIAPAAIANVKGALGLVTWIKWGGALLALTIVGGSGYAIATRAAPTPRASSAALLGPAGPAVTPRPTEAAVQRPPDPATDPATDPASNAVALLPPTLAPKGLPMVGDAKGKSVKQVTGTRDSAPAVVSAASGGAGTLLPELTLMDHARQSFSQGSYADAVSTVMTYEARYPQGSFIQEAEFIRVRALFEQHDPDSPRAARAFLTQYPSSPYAPRVRTLVGGGP